MTSFQISHWKPINQEMRGSITFFRHLHLFRPQFAPRLRPTQHFSVCADASQSTVASGESYDANQAAANDFYARENLTFEQLGFHERLCSSLKAAGFTQTAYVQELAAEAILKEQDTVLAAQTGSGKTLAYLAPIIQLTLAQQLLDADTSKTTTTKPDDNDQEQDQDLDNETDDWDIEPIDDAARSTMIICPNLPLCEQVLAVAHGLTDPATGQPFTTTYLVSSQKPPPFEKPDLIVTTPGALISLLDGAGPMYGESWSRGGIQRGIRRVVLDEADLLLSGSYGKTMDIILDLFKTGDRERKARQLATGLGITLEMFKDLPYHVKRAAMSGGIEAAMEAGYMKTQVAREAGGPPPDFDPEQQQQGGSVHWERQYIFVAATMPIEGGKSVGADIVKAHPNATWLSSDRLHRVLSHVTHTWVAVDNERHRDQALQQVVTSDRDLSQGKGRMLVFCKDVRSADETVGALQQAGLPALPYHKKVHVADRSAVLTRMATEEGLIMVCTDAAARGLDLPSVSHVVQADFAPSAIDFLHRVGRTARAGQPGRVTSLYSPDMEHLVAAIQEAVDIGQPVEGAFSRKRSFSKKFKKYGTFVPRGQTSSVERVPRPPRDDRW